MSPHTYDPRDLVDTKYALSHWRAVTQERLLDSVNAADSPAEYADALQRLNQLNRTVLDSRVVVDLAARYERLSARHGRSNELRGLLAVTLATHGDPRAVGPVLEKIADPVALRLAGPKPFVDLKPVDPHRKWRADGWRTVPGMANYEITHGSVQYRGLQLRTGDILLVDSGQRGGGIYTSFSYPRSNFTHSATVVLLDDQKEANRTIPAVFEMHMGGLRVVPLKRFLSPDFTAYAEAYRLNPDT